MAESLIVRIKNQSEEDDGIKQKGLDNTAIPFDETTTQKWSDESIKKSTWGADPNDSDPTPKHFGSENIGNKWVNLMKFFQDIIDSSISLRLQFGEEKIDEEFASTENTLKIFHPRITSDKYEEGLPVNIVTETTYTYDNFWRFINFILSYSFGESSEESQFIELPIKIYTVKTFDYKIRGSVAYLNKEVTDDIVPVVLLPNVTASLNSVLLEDPNNKYKLFPLNSGASENANEMLITVVFYKLMELFDMATIILLVRLSTQTASFNKFLQNIVRLGFEEVEFKGYFTEYIQKASKLGFINGVINVLRNNVLRNFSMDDVARLFDPDDIEVLVQTETLNLFTSYANLKNALSQVKPVYFMGNFSKSITRYYPDGTFTLRVTESLSFNTIGYLEKNNRAIDTIPTQESGAIILLRPLYRRIMVKPTGSISTIKVRVDEGQGIVHHEVDDDQFFDFEQGQRLRNIYIPTPNWEDAIALSRELNDKYSVIVNKNMSAKVIGELSAVFFQNILNSSLNMSYSYDNFTKTGNINFSAILRRSE